MKTATGQTPKQTYPQHDRLTRDRQLVGFIARHGIVTMEHAMAALGVGRASAYRRAAHCIERGWIERLELLRREPSLLRATRRGLRFAGVGLPLAIVSPASVDHSLRCASTAIELGREHGAARVLSERELIQAERIESRPIASAKVGELPDGRPRLHRPDLVILPGGHPLMRLHTRGGGPFPGPPEGVPISGSGLTPSGVIAVEVELTPKSSRRLESIVRGWRRASWVDEVRYLCAPGPTHRAVERAVSATYASEKVRVLEFSR